MMSYDYVSVRPFRASPYDPTPRSKANKDGYITENPYSDEPSLNDILI